MKWDEIDTTPIWAQNLAMYGLTAVAVVGTLIALGLLFRMALWLYEEARFSMAKYDWEAYVGKRERTKRQHAEWQAKNGKPERDSGGWM